MDTERANALLRIVADNKLTPDDFAFMRQATELVRIACLSLTEEEKALIRGNQKIQAIKSVRERTGLSLREAKDLADAYLG